MLLLPLTLFDEVIIGIQVPGMDELPVSCGAATTFGMSCFGCLIESAALRLLSKALSRPAWHCAGRDEAKGTVAMLVVVTTLRTWQPTALQRGDLRMVTVHRPAGISSIGTATPNSARSFLAAPAVPPYTSLTCT